MYAELWNSIWYRKFTEGKAAPVLCAACGAHRAHPGLLCRPVSYGVAIDLAGNGRRVLVVDGETAVRTLFDRVLSEDDYSVTLVQTVREALLAIKSMTFDLVVFDLSLPGEDGVQTLQQIRRASPRFVAEAMNTAITVGTAATLAKPAAAQERRYAVYRSIHPVGRWQ